MGKRDTGLSKAMIDARALVRGGMSVAKAAATHEVNAGSLWFWDKDNNLIQGNVERWTDETRTYLRDALTAGRIMAEIVADMKATWPWHRFSYQTVHQFALRNGWLKLHPSKDIVLSGSAPLLPVTSIEWLWAVAGWRAWSNPDLDRAGAMAICRAGRLGSPSYGFYIPHPLAERPVPVHTALWRDWITVAEARAAALTYFMAAKDGLPSTVAAEVRRQNGGQVWQRNAAQKVAA